MQIVRRTLFDNQLLRVGHVAARPVSSKPGELEHQSSNILVLPLAGVFAKHSGPHRHVVATPNHAVFIAADNPYRISYPGGIGDQCLTLWFSNAGLVRLAPEIGSRGGFDSSVFASHALLPPSIMLALETLKQLNLEYVRSVDQANPAWFERHLAIDFMNSNPDGTLVDRAAFLSQVARGAGVSDIEAQDVLIRVMGDFAIIHARTSYRTRAGDNGSGRYTDIWSRRDGRWVCVAAHVTRC